MILSSSPHSLQRVLPCFEKLGQTFVLTEGRTSCVKIVSTIGRGCGRPYGSIFFTSLFTSASIVCPTQFLSSDITFSFWFFFQDCFQVPTDGKRSVQTSNRTYGVYDGALNRLNPPVTSEIKDGQWLGVEVASQGDGGKVIVCAHR